VHKHHKEDDRENIDQISFPHPILRCTIELQRDRVIKF
jgi:hypothetical protein